MMTKKIFFIAICAVIFSCEMEEVTKPSFEPFIEINIPSRLLPHSVTLGARFNNSPDHQLTEVGFILSEGEINAITDGQKLVIDDSTREKLSKVLARSFIYHVSGLKKSHQYNVRVFASTDESDVLGDQMTFTTPGTNEWVKLEESEEQHFAKNYPVKAIWVNNRAYITTNVTDLDVEIKTEFKEYDPVTGMVNSTPDFPGKRRIHPGKFSIGNKIFIGPGNDNESTFQRAVWAYNVVEKTWMELSEYPGPEAYAFSAFVIGHKAYLFGTRPLCFWEYNSEYDNWRELTVVSNHLDSASYGINRVLMAVGLNGTGYFVFNRGVTTKAHDVWKYNLETDEWIRQEDLIIEDYDTTPPSYTAISFTNSGKGCFLNDVNQKFYQYYPETDAWSIWPVRVNSVRHGMAAENAIYIFNSNSVHVMIPE